MKLTPRKFARLIALVAGALSLVLAGFVSPSASASTDIDPSVERALIENGHVESSMMSGRFLSGDEAITLFAQTESADATVSVDVEPASSTVEVNSSIESVDAPAAVGTQVRPHISIPSGTTVPYSGIIEIKLTANGKPLNGEVHFGATFSSTYGGLVMDGPVLVEDGLLIFVYEFEGVPIGTQVTITYWTLENSQFLASSTKPRNYEVVRLPQPMITPPHTYALPQKGHIKIKIDIPYIANTDGFPLTLIMYGKSYSVLSTVRSEVKNGYVTFPFDVSKYVGNQLSWDVVAEATPFTREKKFRTASFVSRELTAHYAFPRRTQLAREGWIDIPVSGVGPEHVHGTRYVLNIEVDGQLYEFYGSYLEEHRAARVGYELPEAMIGKTAKVSFYNLTSPYLRSTSVTPRNMEVVK